MEPSQIPIQGAQHIAQQFPFCAAFRCAINGAQQIPINDAKCCTK